MIFAGSWLILMSSSSILWGLIFVKQPKLAYILPFKAVRLTVIETNGGIPLFTHAWSSEGLIDDSLFTGMLHATSQFMDESLKRGNVHEVHLEKAILLIQSSEKYPISSILLVTKSSRSLRHALNKFAEREGKRGEK